MPSHTLPGTISEAVASVEGVSSRIEDAFAQAGNCLGRGHAIFKELNDALTSLSRELSGTSIEGASGALRDIARRLNGLAAALPAESELLGSIGKRAAEAAVLLNPLFKHIQMITIIARSARIEAASLDRDRESFLDFTQEAYELGKAVQQSIEGCARDQELLSGALATALARHGEFETLYGPELVSVGGELSSAYSGMMDQRRKSVELTDLAGRSTKSIAEAVGRSVISLQSGDSTRQRLEHISRALRIGAGNQAGLVPDLASVDEVAEGARLVFTLQAAQLKDTQHEFENDIGGIVRDLGAILEDATAVIGRGRGSCSEGEGDNASFLAVIKQALAQTHALIGSCEKAGKSVDEALSVVEETLGKFRQAIAGLSEAVVDITLIGMNASLKAGHLGAKGAAFVVIANELKLTADQVSGGASKLKPVLDGIEASANDLKRLRLERDLAQLANLEPVILGAIREIEAGHGRLGGLMNRLVTEGAQFEELIGSAQAAMTGVGEASAVLPSLASRVESASGAPRATALTTGDEAVLDDLFAQYTMEREREVHRDFLQRFGFVMKQPAQAQQSEADDGVLLF